MFLLAGLLGLLEFLEFLTSPVGCAGAFGLGLLWGYQYVFAPNLAIAALLAGLTSARLYYWLELE